MRQFWLVLGCALLAACAGRTEMRSARAAVEGELHDAAMEWNADNRAAFQTDSNRPRKRAHAAYGYEPWPAATLSAGVLVRSRSVQPIVREAAAVHGVPADLVNGIIWVESRFVPHARSHKGACGLMQLMPRTGLEVARALGLRYDLYDPAFNIHAGTYYFARMVERFGGDLTLALAAYNAGPGRVEAWTRASQPLPGYSRTYANNVLSAARVFRVRMP